MICTHAHNTAGVNAVAARVRVQAMRGFGGFCMAWPAVSSIRENSQNLPTMDHTGTKRPPRRLDQRTT